MNKPRKNVVRDIEPIGDELSNYPDLLYVRAKRTIAFRPLFVYHEQQIERRRIIAAMRRLKERLLDNKSHGQPPPHAYSRQMQQHQPHHQ